MCLDRWWHLVCGGLRPTFPLFSYTALLPPKTGLRSCPVSVWRFIRVTRLTEGTVCVGCCEANRGSASAYGRHPYMPRDTTYWANRCRSLHVISRPCSGCVHGCLYAICQQEHSCMLSPPPGYTATPLRVHRWGSSISYRTISVITDNMSVGVGRLSSTAARF